jgi:hypothetical protein
MIPVVMLAIDTGALSFILLTLLCLTMTCPSLEHFPVIYLMTVAVRATMLIPLDEIRMRGELLNMITANTQLAHLILSSLVNICATSIIARKTWCVRVGGVFALHFVDSALIGDIMRARIKEISQITDRKWDQYPKPYTGNPDIGSPGRVGYDLHSN